MRFGVLGRVQAWTTEDEPVPIPETKVRALLADLLVHQGHPVSVDRLIDDLWGDDLPANPTSALQLKISRLRHALEHAEPGSGRLVASRPPGYVLTPQSGQSDADAFTELATRAQQTQDPQTRAGILAEALALWRGPAYAEFADADFARSAAHRLEEQRLTALEAHAEARLELGEHALLIGELGDLVTQHPLRERLRAVQMRALYRAGRQSEALASFTELREQLAEQLGLDPSPRLTALQQAILQQDPALNPPTPSVSIAPIRTNLPSPFTGLVGRDEAVDEVRALLDTGRLITLTGPGRVGKTQLAIEIAGRMAEHYPDGTWFVELAGHDRTGQGLEQGASSAGEEEVARTVSAAIGIRDDTSAGEASLFSSELLADALSGKRLLLVLDGCEHIIEPVAKLVEQLLRAAPNLHILATSREPLALAGEVIWPVPPLSPPAPSAQPADLTQAGAVRPSVQRATALRSDTSSFVGRRGETAKLRAVLGEARLVTLTGPAGVGKTRLAIHVARGLERQYSGGVWLVELAGVEDGSLLASAVAASVRMPDISTRDPVAALVDYLADRQLLIVVDNCEHLVEDCAALVSTLIGAVPQLRILATSREPLGIAGERIWPVPPMTTPGEGFPADRGGGREYEALALFRERAEAAGVTVGHSEAVGRLCRRLDGLPLAIELAVPWLRALTVEELADRLDDRFALLERRHRDGMPRHRTLRAAVDWSYDLCTEQERALWARLSVFAGGVSLEAAEAVCVGEGLASEDILPGLAGLVDKSLLVREESYVSSRYLMLETIRHYGRGLLADQADAVRRRHRDYYLRLAEAGARDWWGPQQRALLDQVRAERANIGLALEYCATPSEARTGMRLAGALWWWWITRDLREGRRWLERLLKLDASPSHERALALWVRGMIAADQGDATETLTVAHEGVEVARAVGDTRSEAHNIHWVGMALWMQGKLPEAAAELETALRHYQHTDEQAAISMNVPSELGMILALLGDPGRGIELCEQSVAACDKVDERWTAGWSEWNLAVASWANDDHVAACAHTLRFLQHKRDLDDYFGIPFGLELAAWCASADGDAERAATLLGASDKMWEPVGTPLFSWHALCDWSARCRVRAREIITDQAFQRAYQHGQQLSVADAVAYALNETPAVCGDAGTRPATDTAAPPVLHLLTPREEQVARLVADGRTNRQIAAQLVISERTVGSHIEHIMTKLHVASRTQIAALILKESKLPSRSPEGRVQPVKSGSAG